MRVAYFLHGTAGNLFCCGFRNAEQGRVRGRVLLVAPLFEEMNKSRHITSAIISGLGGAGFDVLMADLYGTGDSEGQFADATLDTWRADLDSTIGAMPGEAPLHIVGLRAGALLAADAAFRHRARSLTLLHPQVDGRQILTQLLRLRLAGGLTGSADKETAAELRQRLAAGETLEIAGYGLSGQLASDLETLAIDKDSPPDVGRILWIEVVQQPERPLMPVSQRVVDAWSAIGASVEASVVCCDQFWATQEIAQCPALVSFVVQQFAS